VFKRYHGDKNLAKFYLQDGGKINWHTVDMERNYVTVTRCIEHICQTEAAVSYGDHKEAVWLEAKAAASYR